MTDRDPAELEALRRVPLLRSVEDRVLGELAGSLRRRDVACGEWLFVEGDDPDALYVVASGRLVVLTADGTSLRRFGAGEPIGELGVISGGPRSAGVRAERDSTVWVVPRQAFDDVLAGHVQVQRALLTALASRLRTSRSIEGEARPRVIAVAGESGASAGVADDLVTALRPFGSATLLAAAGGESDAADRSAFAAALDAAEADNRWVVLDASSGTRSVDAHAMAQADRIVQVVSPSSPADPAPARSDRPVDLLVAAGVDRAAWVAAVRPMSHHALGAAGLQRVARRIAGRSTGLVLAGGGVRGMAHFGVYAELVDAGIEIDRFGGTSAGALASAAFAMDWDVDTLFEVAKDFTRGGRVLSDYTVPAVSLVRAHRVEQSIRDFLGDVLIEEMEKDFFAVSADLVSGEQVVHRQGPAWKAVRASISIPGLMPPVADGDRLLVDGGLLNNLPADVMTDDTDGEAICVDLRSRYEPSRHFGLLPVEPPGLVRRLLTGTSAKLPALQETIMRTVDLAASNYVLEDLPRVVSVISPDVSGVGFLNFRGFDAAVEAGRQAARIALASEPRLAALAGST